MPDRRHGGRPWGTLQAQTPEAEALALFLRAQIDASSLTMTAVAQKINYSRTQTGQYLSGRVPGQDFVAAVIRVTVPDPRLRAHRQAEADRLLTAANKPAPASSASRASGPGTAGELEQVRAQQVDTYERLTRSLEQQAALHEAARNSAQLVMVLLSMISTLGGRVQGLTSERDQLLGRAGDGRVLEDTQRQLARALDQERRAQEELGRAREKQRQAEELAAQVQVQVRELSDELDRLRAETAHAPGEEPSANPESTSPTAPGGTASDPVGDDIEQALARASAVNDTDDQTLQRITHELHDGQGNIGDAAPRSPQAPFPVVVVRDNQDNALTSPADAKHLMQDRRIQAYAGHVADLADAYGPDHPGTLAARSDHAHYVGQAGNMGEAARLHDDLVLRLTRTLGLDHVETLAARSDHAYYVGQAGSMAEAARLYGDLASSLARTLGPDYVETLVARNNHALYVGKAGDAAEAIGLYNELIPDLARTLGPDHVETQAARNNHALYVGKAGDAAEAADLDNRLSPDVAVARLKKAMPDPVRRIDLFDLVQQHTLQVVDAVAKYPVLGGNDAFAQAVEGYQADTDTLLHLLATGVFHDDGTYNDLWLRTVGRLASTRNTILGSFQDHMEKLRHYPALLATWSMGTAAVLAHREECIVDLLTKPLWTPPLGSREREEPSWYLNPWNVLYGDSIHIVSHPETGGKFIYPHSRLINAAVREPLRAVEPDDRAFEAASARFQFLASLIGMDATNDRRRNPWPGEFLLDSWWGYDNNGLAAEIQQEITTDWPLMRAGAFAGDINRANAAFTALTEWRTRRPQW